MKKYSIETTVGIFVVIGLICVGYMAVKLGKVQVVGEDTYSLFARFSTVAGLRVGSEVDIYGIEVGRVKSLSIDGDRQMALVRLDVRKDIKIYDDASATIKTAGLIGDKYIRIEPGGGGDALKPGGTITETSVPADIEDLIGKVAFGDVKKDKDAGPAAGKAAK
jgi:phospholipid/cholesterol/gamma-HCH transport system substrate-binding protein